MNKRLARGSILALVFLLLHSPARPDTPQSPIDPAIARLIASIRAVDNHAHPVLPPPNDTFDREFDALPVDNIEPQTDPAAWKPDNPQLSAAWKALWNFPGTPPLNAEAIKRLDAARNAVKTREGTRFGEWLLDRASIGVMLANRVAMGPGILPPRFRWVPYDDALLFPLNNSALAAETPDKKLFFPLEDRVRARYLQAAGLSSVPPSLDDYLSKVVRPTLERQRQGGAVAVKFELAYLRSFNIGAPTLDQARDVYRKYASGEPPGAAEYKVLQDFLFRAIAKDSGRLGLVVHLHAMSGAGSYFDIAGVNPLLLQSVVNDPQLRQTKFVLLHGGWPFVREAGALLQKPNVYLDLSQQSLVFPPHTLAGWLREWLETFPGKILYGTDAYPFTSSLGWEESVWIANRNLREALGIALTGMLRDGEISRERAGTIAEDVLRKSAGKLYAIQ